MNRLLTSLLGLALLVFFYACKGPQGDVGPAGPQGTIGAAGPAGATGPQGASGVSGIVATPWSGTVGSKTWIQDTDDKTLFYIAFKHSSITQTVLDRGLIMVYTRNTADPSTIYPLPYTSPDGDVESFAPSIIDKEGWLYISVDNATSTTPYDFTVQYRWVIVPPQPGGRLANIDWKNYAEVKKALNLTD